MESVNSFYSQFKSAINTVLDLSTEKSSLVKGLNGAFREAYVAGYSPRLIMVSITIGEKAYAHHMSTFWLRSGFALTIQNDDNLKRTEVEGFANSFLADSAFVRRMMTLGFDTLIVKGKRTESLKYRLSIFETPGNYLQV